MLAAELTGIKLKDGAGSLCLVGDTDTDKTYQYTVKFYTDGRVESHGGPHHPLASYRVDKASGSYIIHNDKTKETV